MKITDFANHLSRFYSSLHVIAGRYGRLNQAIAKYFHHPRLKQTRGLPVNTHSTPESYANRGRGFEIQRSGNSSTTTLPPNSVADLPELTVAYSALSSWLPAVLRKNSILKHAASLPSSAQFSLNEGRFIPFVSQVKSRTQESRNILRPQGVDHEPPTIPLGSSTSANPGPSAIATINPQERKRNQVSITSTAHRLLQVAAGLPLVPLALARSSTLSRYSWTQNSPHSSPTAPLTGLKRFASRGTAPSQNLPSGLAVNAFSLPSHAISTLHSPVSILRTQGLSRPVLGLNRAVASRASPDLGRASRLAESALLLPAPSPQGVYTPNLATGAPQNLSQIVSAYAENEAAQARLHLTSKTLPRTMPLAQLPKLQPTSRQASSYASSEQLTSTPPNLPRLGSSDIQPLTSSNSQPETLPRLSELERRNFELNENDDQVSMEELRAKISQILSEELRRYLPGD